MTNFCFIFANANQKFELSFIVLTTYISFISLTICTNKGILLEEIGNLLKGK